MIWLSEKSNRAMLRGRACYHSVTESPHCTESLQVREEETFVSLRPYN